MTGDRLHSYWVTIYLEADRIGDENVEDRRTRRRALKAPQDLPPAVLQRNVEKTGL